MVPRGTSIKFDCGSSYSYPFTLETDKYKLPVFPGAKLYKCQVTKDNDDYSTVCGEVIMNKKNPALWGIKNHSDKDWKFKTPDGEIKEIATGSVIPVVNGIEITFDGITAKVSK